MAAVDERLERYAELAVRVGANVQAGQNVFVNSQIEHAPLARAITRAAYAAGARYVDVHYRDQHVRKAMIELGPDTASRTSPAGSGRSPKPTPDRRRSRRPAIPSPTCCRTSTASASAARA
jgi:leucyl aminopeptidase (aminopeptidase T)